MCGIVGYIGGRQARQILLDGLRALEYRGYDSAGIAIQSSFGDVRLIKQPGKVSILRQVADQSQICGCLGIGHTRWATHGEPNQMNAHPHKGCGDRVFVVHNGIVENAQELKLYLEARGHEFISQTDTEVIPHLIEEGLKQEMSFKDAFVFALSKIEGAYALAVVDAQDTQTLYAAKFSSPLVIGVGVEENYIASDPTAIIDKTKSVIYLEDGELACIKKDKVEIIDRFGEEIEAKSILLDWEFDRATKGNYGHFMLKEIFEAPDVVKAAFNGRIRSDSGEVRLGGLADVAARLEKMCQIMILACGTSYYASLVGEYFFEEVAHIPTQAQIASEFRYKKKIVNSHMVAIAISQSGETADTLAALKKTKDQGLLTLGIVNAFGSSIARETHAGVYNRAGQEVGVASTKAFLSQLTVLLLMSIYLCGDNHKRHALLDELERIPEKIQTILDQSEKIQKIALKYQSAKNMIYVGRGYNYPVALEGALKLKEISYIHAEGFAAGELKHGPIAMIDSDTPTVAIATSNSTEEKMISNIEEIRARHGRVFVIATEGNKNIANVSDDVFFIPSTVEMLEPFLTIIPLQLFAYYIGVGKGCDVDMPRNLAKSVTVE